MPVKLDIVYTMITAWSDLSLFFKYYVSSQLCDILCDIFGTNEYKKCVTTVHHSHRSLAENWFFSLVTRVAVRSINIKENGCRPWSGLVDTTFTARMGS